MSFADRIRETVTFTGAASVANTAVGVNPIQLPNSASSGYDPFSRRYSAGATGIPVVIAHRTLDEWQACLCTFNSGNTLSVTSIVATSDAADAAVNFSNGDKDIYVSGLSTSFLPPLTSAQLVVGNASNVPTARTITGDVTINNTGVTAIEPDVIVNADVNASAAIAPTKLAFTQAGTGASARTVDAKLKDFVSVKDFGASPSETAANNVTYIHAALAAADCVYIPAGTYLINGIITVPAGKKLAGDGFDKTILRANATGFNGMRANSNCVLLDFTIDGGSHGGVWSGILYEGVSHCYTDRVASINWGAQGFALGLLAHSNKFGLIHATDCGNRGVIVSNAYANSFAVVISRGSNDAGFLLGQDAHHNQIGSLICGNHRNPGLWIHKSSYENQVGQVVVEAPEAGYADNSGIVIGFSAWRNTIGSAIVTGYRRGLQLKGDVSDPGFTDADTTHNYVGALYVTTDNGANAAGVYLDANNSLYAKHNIIGKLHVKNATYGVWDTNGTNTPNHWPFDNATFESVTTPFSITEDVASAATTTLANTSGEYVRVTGTTTITGFGTGYFGLQKTLRFDAALTLTHSSSIILPGTANITTAQNDTASFVCLGSSNWLCTNYKRANGQLVVSVPASTGISGGGGTYTPTLTNVTNVAASTTYTAQYIRIGSVVTVSGKVDVDPTNGANLTQLGISLPFASNFGDESQLQGVTSSSGGANGYGNVRADATNDRAEMYFVPGAPSNEPWSYMFTYRII